MITRLAGRAPPWRDPVWRERKGVRMGENLLERRALADALVERAARGLADLLARTAGEIEPFPPFPGSMFTYGVEVDPPAGSPYGCVIVTNEGKLCELRIGLDEDAIASGGDHVASRTEETEDLDLPPADYIAYAHRAVLALVAYREGSTP